MDLHVLDGAGVREWRSIVFTDRRAVVHADIEAFRSEAARHALVYPTLTNLFVIDKEGGGSPFSNAAAVVFEVNANAGGVR